MNPLLTSFSYSLSLSLDFLSIPQLLPQNQHNSNRFPKKFPFSIKTSRFVCRVFFKFSFLSPIHSVSPISIHIAHRGDHCILGFSDILLLLFLLLLFLLICSNWEEGEGGIGKIEAFVGYLRRGGMDFRFCKPAGDVLLMIPGHAGQIGGGFSHESEDDLALMVSDFLENGSAGAKSWSSSDNDSSFSDLAHFAEEIVSYKHSVDQYGSDLLSVVHSLLLSINDADLHSVKSISCNSSCIKFSLVKLLRLSGYDAAVCASRWQGVGKVPGGYHKYIDVVSYNDCGTSDRLIIDIDFRSHFEIARAVDSYDRILRSLPVVYVGSLAKLKQFLKVMVEAAKSSLQQNSMPLPPWRSLAYLQSKWDSSYQRQLSLDEDGINISSSIPSHHIQCGGHLKRLKSLLQSDFEVECILRPLKLERRRHPSLRNK